MLQSGLLLSYSVSPNNNEWASEGDRGREREREGERGRKRGREGEKDRVSQPSSIRALRETYILVYTSAIRKAMQDEVIPRGVETTAT